MSAVVTWCLTMVMLLSGCTAMVGEDTKAVSGIQGDKTTWARRVDDSDIHGMLLRLGSRFEGTERLDADDLLASSAPSAEMLKFVAADTWSAWKPTEEDFARLEGQRSMGRDSLWVMFRMGVLKPTHEWQHSAVPVCEVSLHVSGPRPPKVPLFDGQDERQVSFDGTVRERHFIAFDPQPSLDRMDMKVAEHLGTAASVTHVSGANATEVLEGFEQALDVTMGLAGMTPGLAASTVNEASVQRVVGHVVVATVFALQFFAAPAVFELLGGASSPRVPQWGVYRLLKFQKIQGRTSRFLSRMFGSRGKISWSFVDLALAEGH